MKICNGEKVSGRGKKSVWVFDLHENNYSNDNTVLIA